MKLYISLPRKYDKTDITIFRKPARKRQRSIKVSFDKEDIEEKQGDGA